MYRLLELNPQLQPFAGDIDLRMELYRSAKGRILGKDQTLNDFANAYNYYGFHHADGGWYYREWAPAAYQLYLEGEFNGIARAKALIPILVPLFISAFRRADELATAMECRCYHGGEGRTKLHVLRYETRDYLTLAFYAALCAAMIALKKFF